LEERLLSVEIKDQFIYELEELTGLSAQNATRVLQDIKKKTLQRTVANLTKWVEQYVPRRTGQLQDSIIKALEDNSRLDSGDIILNFGSNVPQAEFCEDMEDYNVQHSGERGYAYYNGYSGGTKKHPMRPSPARVLLNDPDAKGHWFTEMKIAASDFLVQNAADITRQLVGNVGKITKDVLRSL
jgi:hypothetical protein